MHKAKLLIASSSNYTVAYETKRSFVGIRVEPEEIYLPNLSVGVQGYTSGNRIESVNFSTHVYAVYSDGSEEEINQSANYSQFKYKCGSGYTPEDEEVSDEKKAMQLTFYSCTPNYNYGYVYNSRAFSAYLSWSSMTVYGIYWISSWGDIGYNPNHMYFPCDYQGEGTTLARSRLKAPLGKVIYTYNGTEYTATIYGTIERPTFAGYALSSSLLCYRNDNFGFDNTNWTFNSYNSTKGKTTGSTYFSFIDLGQYFCWQQENFNTSSGNITSWKALVWGGLNWFVPTKENWEAIMGTERAGSTVNGTPGVHYAYICSYEPISFPAGDNELEGYLLFPDGKTINGAEIEYYDGNLNYNEWTVDDINNYVAQGCEFLPDCGRAYVTGGTTWVSGQNAYITATEQNADNNYVKFYRNTFSSSSKTYTYWAVRLIASQQCYDPK